MPALEWSVRASGNARFGLDWTQTGQTLRVTVRRFLTGTAYNNFARTLTVTVAGTSAATANTANNSFPSSMTKNAWVNTDVVNWAFTIPLGVSSVSISVVWNQPATDGWINQTFSTSIPVTPVYTLPAAPTSLVATRNSDTQVGLAWVRNVLSTAPYTSQVVYRRENGGSWVEVATLAGTATTYTATCAANKKYEFKVQARNSAGGTDSATSNVVLTTPAAFASLSAMKASGGIKIMFSKRLVPYTEADVVLELTEDGGGSWTEVDTIAAADFSTSTTTDYTDTAAPEAGTVRYRARVVTNGGTQGTLYSEWTESNELVLNTPPLAPTNLAPSGIVDIASPVVLSWAHTPSSDGAAQSSREIQVSTDGGGSQTTLVAGNSTASTYEWTVDPADYTAGQTILWRVRTAGSQPGTYGDWSAWQSITLRQSMSVTIVSPSDEDTWEGGDIPVEWSATAAWGTASQVGYRITMSTGADVVYDSGSITSNATSAVIPSEVQRNLTEYTITVIVTDNYGLTSLPESVVIDTDFLAPGPVGLEWVYDDNLGQMVFNPVFSEESSSELDDTASWRLERSLDGQTWQLVGLYEGDAPVADQHVRVGAVSWYRATGYTALGVAGEQTVFEIPREDVRSRWGWLGYGDDFGTMVRFGWSQTLEVTSGRASEAFDIEGLEYPAAVFGTPLHERYTVSGKLLYKESLNAGGIDDSLTTASASDFRELAKRATVCLFRDGNGEYIHARVFDVKVAPKRVVSGRPDEASISFTIERVTL